MRVILQLVLHRHYFILKESPQPFILQQYWDSLAVQILNLSLEQIVPSLSILLKQIWNFDPLYKRIVLVYEPSLEMILVDLFEPSLQPFEAARSLIRKFHPWSFLRKFQIRMDELFMVRIESLTFAKCLPCLIHASHWICFRVTIQVAFYQALLDLEHQRSEDHCGDKDQGERSGH